MSPLELIVIIGIISAFTAFALIVGVTRRRQAWSHTRLGAPPRRRDDASNSSARPHSIRLILRRDRWFLRLDDSPDRNVLAALLQGGSGKHGAWRSA